MDFNTDIRRVQLESLEQFILSSKDKVRNVLDVLNWEDEKVLEDKKLTTCTLDSTHKIPQKSATNHVKKCALRKEGYTLIEDFLSEPQHHSESSIMIDNQKKIEILSLAHKSRENFTTRWNGQDPDPRTSDRLYTTYSYDERLALYDYAIANTKEPSKLPEYNVSQPKRDETKPMTYEEQLALERDAKRRRIKYKSVHTSRKTHTEVLREVIESQMEVYRDWIGARTSLRKDDGDQEGRSTSRNSSSSSRSTLRKDLKQKESSDTESVSKESVSKESVSKESVYKESISKECKSRRGSSERNNKKRERSKESIRSFKDKKDYQNNQRDEMKEFRKSRNEGFRRSESERRRYEYKDTQRNESKDYRDRERRNGYKNCCS